jgi:hypothetical protein
MKHLLITILLFICVWADAQVQKNVVVELFSNTRCSVCGALEPGIFNTLNHYPNLIQIAFYPSAPYPNCFFSQQNKSEYDGRTKYYGVFGSTPRLFIQGTEVNNIIDSTVVNPFLNQLSNYEIKLVHKKTSPTDAFITATIIKRATDTQTSAKLYLAIGEDSVAYAAPNGINTHYGVMRKALTDSSGILITLPTNIGDSIMVSKGYAVSTSWNHSNISGYAFLANQTDKSIINANTEKLFIGTFSGIENNAVNTTTIYPNPACNSFIKISSPIATNYEIMDYSGKTMHLGTLNEGVNAIHLDFLASGSYILKTGDIVQKIIIP